MVSPDFEYEKSLLPANCRFILGIDEVGRGPWAGPVTVGAFLLDLQNFNLDFFQKNKICDSKLLSESQRQKIYQEFVKNNYIFKTFSVSSEEIDQQGISASIQSLIAEAINSFDYDCAIIDGNYKLDFCRGAACQRPLISVIKADTSCFSVASASIIAKVVRDDLMNEFDLIYPVYGFKNHKGYGTAKHLAALKTHGPCPIHRHSYKPIKNLSRLPA